MVTLLPTRVSAWLARERCAPLQRVLFFPECPKGKCTDAVHPVVAPRRVAGFLVPRQGGSHGFLFAQAIEATGRHEHQASSLYAALLRRVLHPPFGHKVVQEPVLRR